MTKSKLSAQDILDIIAQKAEVTKSSADEFFRTLLAVVEEGLLSAGHARAILGAPSHDLQREAAKQVVAHGLSVRQTEHLVKALQRQEETKKEPVSQEIALYLGELEKSLSGRLGRKVTISGQGEKGKIQLEYYNSEDLETLLSMLNTLRGEGESFHG